MPLDPLSNTVITLCSMKGNIIVRIEISNITFCFALDSELRDL